MGFRLTVKYRLISLLVILSALGQVSRANAQQAIGSACPTVGWTTIQPNQIVYCNTSNVWALGEEITSTGSVGIGTTNPQYATLTLNGNLSVGNGLATSGYLLDVDQASYSNGLRVSVGNNNSSAVLFEADQWGGGNKFTILGSGNVGIGSTSPASSLDLSQKTDALVLPVGTAAQRPGSPVNGMLRYNSTTTPSVEAYVNGAWASLTGGSSGSTTTLGTSATITSPQRSGDPTTGLYSANANTISVAAATVQTMQWNTLSSGVDYLSVTPGKSGTSPTIAVGGSTSPQNLNLAPSGATGVVQFNRATMFWQDSTNSNIALGATSLPTTLSQSGGGGNGQYNTGLGIYALNANTTGYQNTALGFGTLAGNTGGSYNVAIGQGALLVNTVGYNNTGVGADALVANTSAGSNTAVGSSSLTSNTTGHENTALGYVSLYGNTSGNDNTALGFAALYGNTSGNYNVAIGERALNGAGTGSFNVAVGNEALLHDAAGSGNVASGGGAASVLTSGSNNTILGSQVANGTLTTGSNNILLGTSSAVDTPTSSTSNFLDIGNVIFATGMTGSLSSPAGSVGIGTTAPSDSLDISNRTDALTLPVGTTSQRPTSFNGMLRYNSTIPQIEGYVGGAWTSLGGGAITFGTTAAATNPAISGDLTSGFYTSAVSTLNVSAGGVQVQEWTTLASGVDYLVLSPGLSGTSPKIAVAGSTSPQSLNLVPKGGTGVLQFSGATMFWQDTSNYNTVIGATATPGSLSQSGGGLSGQSDVAIGYQAMNNNTVGYYNVAIGATALTANTNGHENIALGEGALNNNTAGYHNTALGSTALYYVTTGVDNTAVGYQALNSIGGVGNTAVGSGAASGTYGSVNNNTAVGSGTLHFDYTGGSNTVMGFQVGGSTLQSGSYNILVGTSSAVDTVANSTSYNLNIGNILQGDMTNSIALGSEALYLQSTASSVDYIQIAGAATGTKTPVISARGSDTNISLELLAKGTGTVGVGTANPHATLDISGYLRLTKYTSQPVACSSTNDGAIALTHVYTLCICNGGSTSWVQDSNGTTACSW